jgi:hypothetical protein
MASNAKIKSYARGFLNPEKGMAAFDCDVEIWHSTLSSIYFKISDCNRQVSLDFSYDGQEAKDKILIKVQTLVDELNKLKEQIIEH